MYTILHTHFSGSVWIWLNRFARCRASLYERPVNLEAAKKAHAEFRRTMRAAGLRVLTVRDILSFGVEDHMGARVELEELGMRALQYGMAEGTSAGELTEQVASDLITSDKSLKAANNESTNLQCLLFLPSLTFLSVTQKSRIRPYVNPAQIL